MENIQSPASDSGWGEIKKDIKDIRKDIQSVQQSTLKLDLEVSGLKEHISDIKRIIYKELVTREAFIPVKNFVYGTISVVVAGLVTALFALLAK